MARPVTIAIANEKGGVLKSTTAVHLGTALGRAGKRVLVIDVDPQMHAARWLGVPETNPSIYDLFCDVSEGATPAVQASRMKNVWGIPGSRRLGDVDRVLAGYSKPVAMLAWLIGTLEEGAFDFILIDCPPSVGRLAANALVAADHVIAPMTQDSLALDGFVRINATLASLASPGPNQAREDRPEVTVLYTLANARLRVGRDIDEELARIGIRRFATQITPNARGREAFSHKATLFEYDPAGKTGREYDALALEVLASAAPATEASA
jgi:chromosome partitioning protein